MRASPCSAGFVACILSALCLAMSCARRTVPTTPARAASIPLPEIDAPAPTDYPGLHNVVAYHHGFLSGGVPMGDTGFDSLSAMGIVTVISVDGAEPDLASAHARRLRYIHLPIGYNGFDDARRLQLARAVRDAYRDGPVYLHCHHGKHRSSAAAAAVVATLAWSTPDDGVARMKVSGTSPAYTGLYAVAARARPVSMGVLDSVPPDFPERARPSDFVAAMLEIDRAADHLKAVERAGWRPPADHPDLAPAAEAGRLADLCRLAAQGARAAREGQDFTLLMVRNADLAAELEAALTSPEPEHADLSLRFKAVLNTCADCHARFRD